MISVREAIARIAQNNQAYVADTPDETFKAVQERQYPWICVINCADSRVSVSAVAGEPIGQAFNCSVAGTIVEGMRASVEFAVDSLGVKLILVEGHTGCGMVQAALGDVSTQREAVQQAAGQVRKAVAQVGKDLCLSHLSTETQAVIRNAYAQAEEVKSWFKAEAQDERVVVVSTLYDLHNELKGGFGKIYIYSINGETGENLANHTIMNAVPKGNRAAMIIGKNDYLMRANQ